MYITNLDEAVEALRGRLRDYLVLKLGIRANARKFNCYVHNEDTPSMVFNPKQNDEQVHCFGCNVTHDIFAAAAAIEGLPASGPQWVTETIPALAEALGIPIALGEPSAADRERAELYKLSQDITDVLVKEENYNEEYEIERGWKNDHCTIGSIETDILTAKLVEKGWSALDITSSLLLRTTKQEYFGHDKITFVVKDFRGRPIGFISRSLNSDAKQKYINTLENPIYEKHKALFGIETALKSSKREGVYVVEGPGDVAQLNRTGILNVVAVCGTALSEQHLTLLKSLGIRDVYLAFDWDKAGYANTLRVIENVVPKVKGMNVSVVNPPYGEDGKVVAGDPDEYMKGHETPEAWLALNKESAFSWHLQTMSEHETPESIAMKMVPVISTENSAIKRELLIQTLSEVTGLSAISIQSDVEALRNNKFSERREAIRSAAESYMASVNEDPDNAIALMSQHEERVAAIEREYARNVVGVNYQLERYNAIQEERALADDDPNRTGFLMKWFQNYRNAMSGGQSWANGVVTYVGGRANSGKTTVVMGLGLDTALHDDDTIVIIHTTDDSYSQIEPRLKTNAFRMAYPDGLDLSIGAVVNPSVNLKGYGDEYFKAVAEADDILRGLIQNERLVVIDMEDGATLTALERQVKYYRQRFPSKKLLMVCDNTHNYMDFLNLDQTTRMTMIANNQKRIAATYHGAMIATAEYRKNMPKDQSKLQLPVDDDLADARALMYRPNSIFHVYNDLHDRREHAEIFWKGADGEAKPRLLLHFTKNKISSFKDQLVVDLDLKSVSVKPKDSSEAEEEAHTYSKAKQNGNAGIENGKVIYIDAPEYKD